MLFSSITFLILFLPTLLFLYYIVPNLKIKNIILLMASLLFYAWGEPKYVLLMIVSILFNYIMGIAIHNNNCNLKKNKFADKIFLIIAIIINLSALFVFKYLGFTVEIVNSIIKSLHITPLTTINLIMPIGISFYTFQSISYIVDVYREPNLVQKNALNLGLYITFFPQLIAGPIVRYHDINLQIENRKTTLEQFYLGFQRFIIGLSKKVLLANSFALICDKIYEADYFTYGTFLAWIACFAYALQMYYDFSGYSDMAIGLAKLFGFELLENFNYPYSANSVTDFWKRWHISMTNWFRDYLYIPLGGNRKGDKRTIINRFIVFFTTGLWHGAAFNFIGWGVLHGCFMTVEKKLKIRKEKIKKINHRNITLITLQHLYTIIVVVLLWVFFRNDIKTSVKMLLKLLGINYTILSGHEISIIQNTLMLDIIDFNFFLFFFIGILFTFPWWHKIYIKQVSIKKVLFFTKNIVLIILLILCMAKLADNSYNPFIYFRF